MICLWKKNYIWDWITYEECLTHPHINQQYWFIYNHSNLTIILILEEMILILDWFHCFLNKPVEGDKLLRIDKPQLTILKG